MLKINDETIIEFWALHVSTLTPEIARNLEAALSNLPGVERFTITLETQEFHVLFNQDRLDFQTLTRKMASAGCFLRDIDAAVLL